MKISIILAVTLTISLTTAVVVINQGNQKHSYPQNGWGRKAALETPAKMAGLSSAPVQVSAWPPVHGQKFPEVHLFDHQGKRFSVSSLAGKPTLIEFVAMSCAGCQAFSGGNQYGGFQGFASQPNLGTIEEYFQRYTGYELHSSDINFVQIVVYDLRLKSPSAADLSAWRKHFRLNHHSNTFVVSGGDPLANKASYAMIPGFLLLDSEQVIRYDSTGHQPKHGLYTELLPAAKKMLDQRRP